MTPKVQSLSQIVAELNPAYAGSKNVITQQQSALGGKYDTQREALGAEKVQGFNTINNQATGRSLSFSGIPLDEQATYLSTKYLPAYAQTYTDQNAENLTLQGQLAQLNLQQSNQALSYRQQQQDALNAWNLQQAQQKFQAEQNRLDRNAAASARAATSAANAAPTLDDTIRSQFANWSLSNTNWRNDGSTEALVNSLRAAYGQTAVDRIYQLRKEIYGS